MKQPGTHSYLFFYNSDEDGKNQKKEEKKMGSKDGPLRRRGKEGGQLGLAPGSLGDENLQIGTCLRVAGYLEGNPVSTILDSGAGVSIVGRKFVALYGRTFGHPPPMDPITLTVTGVNSAATLRASAVTSFMLSFGPRAASHRVSAVVVPGWDGEILLGWHNLMRLGITFVLDREGIPSRVMFARLGVECELMGPCSDEAAQETRTMVQAVVAQIGKDSTPHLRGLPSGRPLAPGEEKLVREYEEKKGQGDPKGAPRTPGSLRREGAEPDPKVRKCDIQPLPSGKDRRLHWRIQQRKQWQSYKRQGTERTQVEVRLAVAESLKPFLAREGKQESEDGWAISEEGLEKLT